MFILRNPVSTITWATVMTRLRVSQPRKPRKYLLYLLWRWRWKVATRAVTFSSPSSTTLLL